MYHQHGGLVGAAADVVPALSSLLLIIVVLPTISRVLWAIGLVGIVVHTVLSNIK